MMYLSVVRRGDSVHVTRNLCSQIRNGDELGQNVLRNHVRETWVWDVLTWHVDVIRAEVQIGGRYSAHSPVGASVERLLLVLTVMEQGEKENLLVPWVSYDRVDDSVVGMHGMVQSSFLLPGGGHGHLVSVYIRSLSCDGTQLGLLSRLFLDFCDLLPLLCE